jgi:hypothetical protein
VQPCPSVRPYSIRRAWRYSKHLRRPVHRQPGEVPQLHELGRLGVFGGQASESGVEGEKIVSIIWSRDGDVVKGYASAITPVLGSALSPSGVDQNAPHRLGGRGEEVPATLPVWGQLDIDQPQIRLMYESGWLQGLPGMLVRQASRRELFQLFVNQGEQALRRKGFAVLNLLKNLGNVGHVVNCKPRLNLQPPSAAD